MSVLNIHPDALEQRANELDQARAKDEELMRQMRSLVMNLDQVWQGDAEKAFVRKFQSRQKDMNQMQNCLKGYIKEAKNAATQSRRLDQTLKKLVDNLLGMFRR